MKLRQFPHGGGGVRYGVNEQPLLPVGGHITHSTMTTRTRSSSVLLIGVNGALSTLSGYAVGVGGSFQMQAVLGES